MKLDESKKEHKPVKDLVERKILPDIKKTFDGLISHLTTEHGTTIQHDKNENPSSNFAKATVHPDKNASTGPSVPSTSQHNKDPKVVNVTSFTDELEFNAPTELLYNVFVDEKMIAAFTRAPIKLVEGAHTGGKFVLFNGVVSGEYRELDKPNRIVQTWREESWPKDHYSTLRLDFKWDSRRDATHLDVTWTDVPVGKEDQLKQKWSGMYVAAIKQTFG